MALNDTSPSGIFVVEDFSADAPIPIARDTVAAFVGPTPRGPADVPVTVRSVADFYRCFGVPGHHSRIEHAVLQFFANGGVAALVVRVAGSTPRSRIVLPGPDGKLVLQAANPGPLETLRAAVDYEKVSSGSRFNLVVQRLRSARQPVVEEQESYRDVSLDPDSDRSLWQYLLSSSLVRPGEASRPGRPWCTADGRQGQISGYVHSRADWLSGRPVGDYDLIGSEREGTGLHALDSVSRVDLVCLFAGKLDADLGPVVLLAADQFCRRRDAMLIVDPPGHWQSMRDVVTDEAAGAFTSPNALTYFPRLGLSGDGLPVSAAGAIAGALASGDQRQGTWRTGRQGILRIRSHERPALELHDADLRLLRRLGINGLRSHVPGRLALHGMTTLEKGFSLASEWRSLRLRRTALFILGSLREASRWTLFRRPGADTWDTLRCQIEEFLGRLYRDGALAGTDARDAYYVSWDSDSSVVDGNLSVSFVVGFALTHPGEFLSFRIVHDSAGCRISEVPWQPAPLRPTVNTVTG
jgi:hypothetical protein